MRSKKQNPSAAGKNLKPLCLPRFMSLKKGAEEGKGVFSTKNGYKLFDLV